LSGRSFTLALVAVVLAAACPGSRPEERATPTAKQPTAAAAIDAGATRRNAGVLEPAYGGLVGSDDGSIPGFPPPEPHDACQERIAHVRQLACKAGVDRDGPRVTAVRDAVLKACGDGDADALACLQAATTFEAAARCPRKPAPASPGDCEAMRLHMFSLDLVDGACHGAGSLDMEHYLVNRLARFVPPEPWAKICGKAEPIPRRVLRCVLDATTATQSAGCGL